MNSVANFVYNFGKKTIVTSLLDFLNLKKFNFIRLITG